jgi:lipopolysaccharide assembly outer membrane protein LptD (OstA)
MLNRPIGKDSQIGSNVYFENKILRTYFAANYSQKRNTLNFGQTGIEIQLPETRLILSRNFQTNVPLLNSKNKLDYVEFSIERSMSEGYKFIGGISKDLDSKKNLESYFGFGFENCCLAFKIYASDKRLSKYNLLNFQSLQFDNISWDRMISIENKSRINFEFELKGLTGGKNDKRNRLFSNTFLNLN